MENAQSRALSAGGNTDARDWTKILARYRQPNGARSIVEITITVIPLVALWAAVWAATGIGYWLSLLLAVPAAGFLVRLFMIQHDCSHGAFFRHRLANDWVGRVIGVLTLTRHDVWRRSHAVHHATLGNLDRRGLGDIGTLTLREYTAGSCWKRFAYRLYRHPLVMFGIGPAYLFILEQRVPTGLMRAGWQPWISTMATNLAIVALAATVIAFIGLKAFMLVHLPIILLAASIGVWLFYVQHQFPHSCGQTSKTGIGRRPLCMARLTMICLWFYAGLLPTSACITSITCAAAFHIIAFRMYSAIFLSCATSGR
jgi:omega-6 fatty acid desaturase (delta-12 desaturase)